MRFFYIIPSAVQYYLESEGIIFLALIYMKLISVCVKNIYRTVAKEGPLRNVRPPPNLLDFVPIHDVAELQSHDSVALYIE